MPDVVLVVTRNLQGQMSVDLAEDRLDQETVKQSARDCVTVANSNERNPCCSYVSVVCPEGLELATFRSEILCEGSLAHSRSPIMPLTASTMNTVVAHGPADVAPPLM
jgi:hypothetical protein